jgi:CHASE2 domain-containing sensor protein/two-component sensor histidine kinase
VLKRLPHYFQRNDLTSSALILLLLAVLIHTTALFGRVDHLVFDIGQKLQTAPAPDDLIIVAIDEASLSQLGRWPWSRETHAAMLSQLNAEKPLAIGFDVIFSEPELTSPQADVALAEAMQASGRVVLPVLLETTRMNGQMMETLPIEPLMQHAADIGRVHALLDEDSIARGVYLYEGIGKPTWQLFGQAVVNVATGLPSQNQQGSVEVETPYSLVQRDRRSINFLGPPGHFQTISYVQVLNRQFEPGTFHNKIVLIGATALGMNDLLSTPVSGLSQPMSGVEFHANVIEAIRHQRLITTLPNAMSGILVGVLVLIPLIWLPKVSALVGFVSALAYLVAVTLCMAILPRWSGVWFPPSAALIPILVAYPIWSWRKLEAAQRFLDEELSFLRSNLMGASSHQMMQVQSQYDVFDARIAQVRMASEQLKLLQEDKQDTLAFISHDLRAPIGTAIHALERFPEAASHLNKPLRQALHLAEDFLHASRAEMMDRAKFKELELAGLVHQAIDDAYEVAMAKDVMLTRHIEESLVWVDGSFGLLHRASLNLILNAVKYSPKQAEVMVELKADVEAKEAVFSVTDHGPGIALNEQQGLFKRFSRVKEQDQAEGTGLGLYFVKTVAEKHGGSIMLESDLGKPTKFILKIPIKAAQNHS